MSRVDGWLPAPALPRALPKATLPRPGSKALPPRPGRPPGVKSSALVGGARLGDGESAGCGVPVVRSNCPATATAPPAMTATTTEAAVSVTAMRRRWRRAPSARTCSAGIPQARALPEAARSLSRCRESRARPSSKSDMVPLLGPLVTEQDGQCLAPPRQTRLDSADRHAGLTSHLIHRQVA